MPEDDRFAELLRRVRAGDAEAAEELVRSYERAVRVAVRVRLSDPRLRRVFDSVDVCQSVMASFFVRAAAGQYDLDTPAQLVGLLTKMAKNKLAMQARFHHAQQRDVRAAGTLEGAAEPAAGSPTPDRVAEGRDLLAAFRGRLSPEEAAIADRRGAGQAWAEIAAALGGTPDQRRVQFQRAVDRVAAELGLDPG